MLPHAQSGKLRILAVSGAKRSRFLPNVPTFAESGFKDVAAEEFFAVFMPAKRPADVLAKLKAAIQKTLKAKPLIERLEKLLFEGEGQSPAEFSKIVRGELDRWGQVVKASGLSSED